MSLFPSIHTLLSSSPTYLAHFLIEHFPCLPKVPQTIPVVVADADAVAIVAVVVAVIAVAAVVVAVAVAAVVLIVVAVMVVVPPAEVLQVVAPLVVVLVALAVVLLVAALPVVVPHLKAQHSHLVALRLNVAHSLLLRMFEPLASNVQDMGLLAEPSIYLPIISRRRSTRAQYIITTVRTLFCRRRVYLTGPPFVRFLCSW
jgi:hypothetical protein